MARHPFPEGTPLVHVDESMFNAARLIRLIGTANCKGFATPDQPHRRSCLRCVPARIDVVPVDRLKQIAALATPRPGRSTTAQTPRSNHASAGDHRLHVDAWLNDRGVSFSTRDIADGRTAYLIQCPFDSGHGSRGETCVMQDADGKMSALCMHDSCSGKGWQEFKEAIGPPDPDHYDPPLRTSNDASSPPQDGQQGGDVGAIELDGVGKHTPEGMVYQEGEFLITVARERTRWRVSICRGGDPLSISVVHLAEAKGRRELLRSLQGVSAEDVEVLEQALLRLAINLERHWAEHTHWRAGQEFQSVRERIERAAAE
jgi:hypothetical protein